MVNYGQSRACITCKNRKIKCDQSRPACRKCQKIGKICPGYPDDWDLSFRSENAVVYKKVHRYHHGHGQIKNDTTHKHLGDACLNSALVDDIHLHAIPLFFRDYVLAPFGKCPGWLNFVPDLYVQSSEDSMLRLAVQSVAYASLAQKTARQDISIIAISYYQSSLLMVNQALRDHETSISEVTMTVVILLGLYELINTKSVKTAAFDHSQGLGALADLRGSLLLEGNGSSLLPLICCQMQRRNLSLELAPGPADERLIRMLDSSRPASRVIINTFQVSKLVAKIKSETLQRDGNITDEFYASLERQVHTVDLLFQKWHADVTAAYGYPDTDSSNEASLKMMDCAHKFSSSTFCQGVWNKHRTARILLHQKFLETPVPIYSSHAYTAANIYEHSGHRAARILLHQRFLEVPLPMESSRETPIYKQSAQRAVSQSIILDMTAAILAGIPFSLGDMERNTKGTIPISIGGYFLVWSLQVILRCPFITIDQRMIARTSLERIGRECGISYATLYARTFVPL